MHCSIDTLQVFQGLTGFGRDLFFHVSFSGFTITKWDPETKPLSREGEQVKYVLFVDSFSCHLLQHHWAKQWHYSVTYNSITPYHKGCQIYYNTTNNSILQKLPIIVIKYLIAVSISHGTIWMFMCLCVGGILL